MSLCISCKKAKGCLDLPEHVKDFAVFVCEKYETDLRLPRGFGKFKKALDRYGAQEGCSIKCEQCLLHPTGICDGIAELQDALYELLGEDSAESAQGV